MLSVWIRNFYLTVGPLGDKLLGNSLSISAEKKVVFLVRKKSVVIENEQLTHLTSNNNDVLRSYCLYWYNLLMQGPLKHLKSKFVL